jgi:hypothetical protein
MYLLTGKNKMIPSSNPGVLVTFLSLFILFSVFSCTTENPVARNAQTTDDESGVGFLPVDRSVLVNNLWKKESPEFTGYLKFFDNGYMTWIDRKEIADYGGVVFSIANLRRKWEIVENTLIYTTLDGDNSNTWEGGFINEATIRGKGRKGDLVLVTDEEIINEYNSSAYAFCPMPLFPVRDKLLRGGGSEISISNPNDFSVAVAIMTATEADYFLVSPQGSYGRGIPDGQYDIYFVYSTEPESLYQGDRITARRQKMTLTLQPASEGNYGMKKIK